MLMSIPSPSQGTWELGPLPIRAYALSIIVGIIVAVLLGERRWEARGGDRRLVGEVALWGVPFGIVGGRLYHVITDWQLYFSDEHWRPWEAFAVWQGGLGMWGGISMGALGCWIALRRRGIPFAPFADAIAPGVAFAQGIGRWGNYFNQELYGKPTTLPWGLEIDAEPGTLFHPTFLYEFLWCIALGVLLLVADRKLRLGGGRVAWLLVAGYTAGRAWIENLRIDPAHRFFGLRLNDYVSLALFALAAVMLYRLRNRRREDPAGLGGPVESADPDIATAPSTDDSAGLPVRDPAQRNDL